jgi:hypothetical protein
MQTVVETPSYLRDLKRIGLTEFERQAIIDFVARHPDVGDEIRGTGGARKVRFAGKGKGKSGGFRVVTFYTGKDIPLFLMSVFAKNEKVNLTAQERNELHDILGELAETYRERVKEDVKRRKKTYSKC